LSEKFDNKLILELNVSYLLIGAISAGHVGAALLVAIVPLAWALRAGLWIVLAVSLVIALRSHIPRFARSVSGIEWDSDGSWSVRLAGDNAWYPCDWADGAIYPHVVILRLRRERARRTTPVIIPSDAVAPDAFRRLRARLRLARAAG